MPLDISGYFNRLLHEHAGEAEFLQLRRMAEEVGIPLCSVGGIISFSIYPLTAREPEVVQTSMMQSGGCWTQLRCWERPLLW